MYRPPRSGSSPRRPFAQEEQWLEFPWSGDGNARLCFSLHGPLTAEANTIVTRVRFKSSNGILPAFDAGLSFSERAGSYFYPLKLVRRGEVRAVIAPPPGTSAIQVCWQHWRRGKAERFEYSDLSLEQVEAVKNVAAPNGPSISAISLLDEFSQACWRPEINLHPLSREQPIEQIEGSTSDFLFMESAWHGNERKWSYAMTSPELSHANAKKLLEALGAARKRSLPVVFWNKEDPMRFEMFLPIAREADIVFTTDEHMIPLYRERLGHDRIFALPFAAQPRHCNPADRFREPMGTICFAGSYCRSNHDDRRSQMDALLPVIPKLGGVIYDRMSEQKSENYRFPEQYRPCIRPRISFEQMVKEYRRFKLFLNFNTITKSDTMMSRRVYEILASGTPVISAPSRAIERQFPGIVFTAPNALEAERHAEKLLSDEELWMRASHLGYREVMRHHTYRKRLAPIAASLGIAHDERPPLISIITATRRTNMIDRLSDNIARQTYPEFESVIVTHGYSADDLARLENALSAKRSERLRNFRIIPIDGEVSVGRRHNAAIESAMGVYVAIMDDDDFFFPEYLYDMMLPFSFTDAVVVGKREAFVYHSGLDKTFIRRPGTAHRHIARVHGGTLVGRRSVFRTLPFVDRDRGYDTSFLSELTKSNARAYAADKFNFIQFRGAAVDHAWPATDEELLRSSAPICEGLGERFAVI